MKSGDIFEQFRSKIDQLKYVDKTEKVDVGSQFTVDWFNCLPLPPKNTSEVTMRELKYLEKLTKHVYYDGIKLVETVDKEPLDLFKGVLRKYGLKFNESDFQELWSVCKPVVLSLKNKFNRPRPYQLAQYFGLKINVIETKTHQTPSYPSGHTCYTALAAHFLSATFPEHSSHFFDKVGVTAYARCLQGVHYPSDNDAAMTLSGVLWEDLKYKMFPNLFPEINR